MKLWKKCPLLLLLTVSGLILGVIGAANRNGIYREYKGKTVMTPPLAAVFVAARDGIFPWSDAEEAVLVNGEVMDDDADAPQDSLPLDENGQETKPGQPKTELSSETAQEAESQEPETAVREPEETAEAEKEQTYSFTRVEEDYFDDALFIGDSRTQGMLEYGGLENRAAFYCQTSLTIYDLFKKNKAFIKEDGRKLTLTEALTAHQFGKIYLMIGINEMGTGTPESFFEEYARAVFKIRELQPDAVIFVQGIMRVAGEKNASDPIFNNTNINIRNVEIQTLADNRDIFYIDVNEAVCDESGNLHDDWTFDQIHLKAKYYLVWKEFLLDHGIVRG